MTEIPDNDTVPVLISPGGEAEPFCIVTTHRSLAEDEIAAYGVWAGVMAEYGGRPVPGFGVTIERSFSTPDYPDFWIIRGYGIREKKQ